MNYPGLSRTIIRKYRIPPLLIQALLITSIFLTTHISAELPNPPGGNFTLYSQKGSVSLADFRGKVVAIYFGYTSCGAVCPMSLAQISAAMKKLSRKERKKVAGIFISIDPDRDTPKQAANYAKQFDPLIVGLSGKLSEIKKVADQYGAVFMKVDIKSSMQYACDHSSYTYIVNPVGKLVKILPHGVSSEIILNELRNNME